MGFDLGSLFSTKQNTQGTTTGQQQQQSTSNQSSTQTTQNNLWPQLSGIFQQYQNSFTPAPFNAYQTNAADRQDNVTGNLNPGFGAAGSIASGGLSPTAYQAYMNPYVSSVVNPTIQAYDITNKQALSNIDGNLATKGALGNSNNNATKALYYQAVLPQQQAQIGNLYSQGYGQAVDTALKSQGQQLQGASTLAGLTGAATGANTAGFNIGQTLWQDPLSWQTQWAGALSPFLQGAGTTSTGNSTGTSSGSSTSAGTSNSTTTSTPSPFQMAMGIGGILSGISGFGGLGGSGGGWVNPDTGGSFNPSSGLYNNFADGGSVKGYDEGGAVTPGAQPSFHELPMVDKLKSAFDAFNGMAKASGGGVKPYAGGGEVDPETDAMGGEGGGDVYSPRQQVVGGEAAPMPVGVPGVTPAPRAASVQPRTAQSAQGVPASYQAQQTVAPYSSTPYWDAPSFSIPNQPLANGFMSPMTRMLFAGSGPLIGQSMAQQAGETIKERQSQQAADWMRKQSLAQMTGEIDGRKTMEAQKLPSQIELQKAQAALARTNADKDFLLQIEQKKMEFQKQLALQQMEREWDLMEKIMAKRKANGLSTDKVPMPDGAYVLGPDGQIKPKGAQ